MKIYTRTGDSGETGLFGGGRVSKSDSRVDAYGEVDELNAVMGLVVAVEQRSGEESFLTMLRPLQEDLFAIGAHLATPSAQSAAGAAAHLPALPAGRIAQMEAWIDEADADLAPLRSFILPGGTEKAALLHLARTVCRRAERRVAGLASQARIDDSILIYLNRLSDLLFVLARLANHRAGGQEVRWSGRG